MSLTTNHNIIAESTARNLNAHYANLAQSTQQLSSGLRVNSAADDTAGLAIRELQRAEISTLHQGARNANDAVSMIQTADGALAIIDEKLLRMKELAEQAATGTYDSTQRLMINSEFVAMRSEIDRIANATAFNGIHLLDGKYTNDLFINNLTNPQSGPNDMLVHYSFNGTLNSSTGQDPATIEGDVKFSSDNSSLIFNEGAVNLPEIDVSKFTTDFSISLNVNMQKITMHEQEAFLTLFGGYVQIFYNDNNNNTSGVGSSQQVKAHTIAYMIGDNVISSQINHSNKNTWVNYTMTIDDKYFTAYENGNEIGKIGVASLLSPPSAASDLNALGKHWWSNYTSSSTRFIGGMDDLRIYNRTLSKNEVEQTNNYKASSLSNSIKIHFGSGNDSSEDYYYIKAADASIDGLGLSNVTIETQDKAQTALNTVADAIVKKDNIRAYYGAMQNRLENTITSLNIQAENLQASESRISDVDVSAEMTNFTREQILSQSAVAMLAQANSLPQMAMKLIGG